MSKRQANRTTKAAYDRGADMIITMDPASTSNSGICVRPTTGVITPKFEYVRSPEWYVTDVVWNTQMHDDLARVIAKWVPRGGHVVFASTSTAFQGTALAIGRAIGCIEGMLHDLNVYHSWQRVEAVQDITWRRTMYPYRAWKKIKAIEGQKERRAAWKQIAVDTVLRRYEITTDDNAAEAILLNDHVVLWREDLWKPGGVRREFDTEKWKKNGYGAQRT